MVRKVGGKHFKMILSQFHFFELLVIILALTVVESRKRKQTTTTESTNDMLEKEKLWVTGNTTHPVEILLPTDSTLKIGSFNMKQFGTKKANDGEILRIISKIVMRYDMIALQEITDVKEKAIKRLMDAVNRDSSNPYHYAVSPRVGRSKQKEQYALIYRPDFFKISNSFLFDDTEGDLFSREPHISEVIIKATGQKIAFINIHVAPRDAPLEINYLTDVAEWVKDKLKIKNILILGDLNAACDYIRKKDKPSIRLMNNPNNYIWLIPDNFDTTVGNTECAYDRIIVSGPYLVKNWLPGSAGVFEFDEVYGLDKRLALNVSDHYPVEFTLRVERDLQKMGRIQSASTTSVPDKLTFFGVALALSDILYLYMSVNS